MPPFSEGTSHVPVLTSRLFRLTFNYIGTEASFGEGVGGRRPPPPQEKEKRKKKEKRERKEKKRKKKKEWNYE